MDAQPNRWREQGALKVGLVRCSNPFGHQREVEPRRSCFVTTAFLARLVAINIPQVQAVALVVVVSKERPADAPNAIGKPFASLSWDRRF